MLIATQFMTARILAKRAEGKWFGGEVLSIPDFELSYPKRLKGDTTLPNVLKVKERALPKDTPEVDDDLISVQRKILIVSGDTCG